MIRRPLLMLLAATALSGCALGPHNPQAFPSLAPTGAGNASLAPIAPASGPAQTVISGGTVASDWWRSFGSEALDALVARALAANNDIQTADAALRQAREQARAAGGVLLPQVDASYQAERAKASDVVSPPLADPNQTLYTLHTAQLSVAYPVDLFGANRSHVRSAQAAARVQGDRLLAARTTVIANLVQAVIQRGSLIDQIAAADTAVQVNRDVLDLLRKRQMLGAIGAADVAVQQTALATAEGVAPPLRRTLAHQEAIIASLIGLAPGNPLPEIPTLDALALPAELPVALPSDLVRRRPDVLAAAAQMEGAAADVGAAIAARLPGIQLTAAVGGVATKFGEMFADGNPFYTLIGGITQPLFHGGALRHQQHAAEAALDGAKSQYRAAVLQAFVDVSDALTGLRSDADVLDAASRSNDAATRELGFVRRQLELGDVGTLSLLNATSAAAQARSQLIQARAARLSDSVALFQASGGGVTDKGVPRG